MRSRVLFWLDHDKPEEKQLVNYIRELKELRQFMPTLRDALLLIRELRRGSITLLLELFPDVRDKIREEVKQDILDEYGTLSDIMEQKLESFKAWYRATEQTQQPVTRPQLASGSLNALPPPSDDDIRESLEVNAPNNENSKATQNFLTSMMQMQGMNNDQITRILRPLQEPEIKKMEGADRPLEIPTFDDLDDLELEVNDGA